jgi:hypothetical protein
MHSQRLAVDSPYCTTPLAHGVLLFMHTVQATGTLWLQKYKISGVVLSMEFTYWEYEGTEFPRNPMREGGMVFSTKWKKPYPPLQSPGTRLRASFTLRKQYTKQVTPAGGLLFMPIWFTISIAKFDSMKVAVV